MTIGPPADAWAFGCVIYDAFCRDGQWCLFPNVKSLVGTAPLPSSTALYEALNKTMHSRLNKIINDCESRILIRGLVRPLSTRLSLGNALAVCTRHATDAEGSCSKEPANDVQG